MPKLGHEALNTIIGAGTLVVALVGVVFWVVEAPNRKIANEAARASAAAIYLNRLDALRGTDLDATATLEALNRLEVSINEISLENLQIEYFDLSEWEADNISIDIRGSNIGKIETRINGVVEVRAGRTFIEHWINGDSIITYEDLVIVDYADYSASSIYISMPIILGSRSNVDRNSYFIIKSGNFSEADLEIGPGRYVFKYTADAPPEINVITSVRNIFELSACSRDIKISVRELIPLDRFLNDVIYEQIYIDGEGNDYILNNFTISTLFTEQAPEIEAVMRGSSDLNTTCNGRLIDSHGYRVLPEEYSEWAIGGDDNVSDNAVQGQ